MRKYYPSYDFLPKDIPDVHQVQKEVTRVELEGPSTEQVKGATTESYMAKAVIIFMIVIVNFIIPIIWVAVDPTFSEFGECATHHGKFEVCNPLP